MAEDKKKKNNQKANANMDRDNIGFDFDCSLVYSFRKKFFAGDIPPKIEDMLIAHLLRCKECNKKYIDYAETIGVHNFNIQRYALRFFKKYGHRETSNVKDWLIETRDKKLEEALSQKWTQAAKEFDINQLMNMKAFRDLSQEYASPTGEDYTDFYQHLALKFAKRIDFLELCLFKEYKEKPDAKS